MLNKNPVKKPIPSTNKFQGTDVEALKMSFINHLKYSLAKDEYTATDHDCFASLALMIRDRLIERWIETQQTYYKKDVKRVYYLSLEFLIGRTLGNSLINLGLYDISEDRFFNWRGCHRCNVKAGKMLGNTVHEVVGFISLQDCINKNGYEFRLCDECIYELIYGE